MKFQFYKYQGTGNDFILIDDRNEQFPINATDAIAQLCHRRFGIGADGLILLRNHVGYDFEMVYYNSDGRPSSMCGNGGRCIAAFARFLGLGSDKVSFLAVDGPHVATFHQDRISLQMKEVDKIDTRGRDFVLNTGSPHYVSFQDDVPKLPIVQMAKAIRYNDEFSREGINVNFVEKITPNHIRVRTYERGVEDETYSCGTGVVGAAIAYHYTSNQKEALPDMDKVAITTLGGELEVSFEKDAAGSYKNVWLHGPAFQVFDGHLEVDIK